MNSMSRPHCNDDSDVRYNKHREDDCCRKHKNTEVLLKCGSPSSRALPIVAAAALGTPAATFPVASLNLNTTGLCNPCIKFEFSSNIVTTAALALDLTFQIVKQCRNQLTATNIGPSWTFTKAALIAAETFSFHICECDCDFCPEDCCTYTVVVTTGAAITVGGAINNATLSALVVESNCHCC